jgi:uncharacterized protein YbaR (Trm112 family)
MPLTPELLALLRCPESRSPLIQDGDTLVSTHAESRRRYSIEEGIPNLIIDDSVVLDVDAWVAIMTKHKVVPNNKG